MATLTSWSSKMNFHRNKSKNNHDKESNCRSTSPGGYSVSQLFSSSPKRKSPPQRSVTTQQLSNTPPQYDDAEMGLSNPRRLRTAGVPMPPGRSILKTKLSVSSAAASDILVSSNSTGKDSYSPHSGGFSMDQGNFRHFK